MRAVDAFAYFWWVGAKRVYFLTAFGAIVAMGVFTEMSSSGSSDFATVMILVVQMFAVSTGFVSQATRGFYDPVLARSSRLRAAATHFAAAALPGWLAWALLASVEVLRTGSLEVIALRPTSIVGLLLVSAVAWSLNLPFAPFCGGGAWFVLSIAIFVSGRFIASLAPLARDPAWSGENPGRALLIGLIFPILMPGISFPAVTLAALVAISIFAIAAGVFFLARRDFTLAEEA